MQSRTLKSSLLFLAVIVCLHILNTFTNLASLTQRHLVKNMQPSPQVLVNKSRRSFFLELESQLNLSKTELLSYRQRADKAADKAPAQSQKSNAALGKEKRELQNRVSRLEAWLDNMSSETFLRPQRNFTTAIPDTIFRGFEERDCSSSALYRDISLQKGQRLVYMSAKFGYRQRFRDEMLQRQQQVIEKFPWVKESNSVAYYELPQHWREYHPYYKHTRFLENPEDPEDPKIHGYWFWKSALILDHLRQLNPGDVLIYADYDQTFWWPALTDLLEHFLNNLSFDWALAIWPGPVEMEMTKKDVFLAHCGDAPSESQNRVLQTVQWDAGFHFIRKNNRTLQLAQFWQQETENYHALSDAPSYVPNDPKFWEHRRDQSLLNLILKCIYEDSLSEQAEHPCGFNPFHFISLPDRTDAELLGIKQRQKTFWDQAQREPAYRTILAKGKPNQHKE